MFEHYEPYAEAVTTGELPSPSEALPRIAAQGDVWSHVSLVFVSVTPLSGLLTTELGYTTDWDDEHTLARELRPGSLITQTPSPIMRIAHPDLSRKRPSTTSSEPVSDFHI